MSGISNYLSQYHLAPTSVKLAALNAFFQTGLTIEQPDGLYNPAVEKVGKRLSLALIDLRNEHENEVYRRQHIGERATDQNENKTTITIL